MDDALRFAYLLRTLADAAEPRQFTISLGVTEARQIARELEQLTHENRLVRQLVHDAQKDNLQLLSELGRSRPDARS